jgi:hypothetical protein
MMPLKVGGEPEHDEVMALNNVPTQAPPTPTSGGHTVLVHSAPEPDSPLVQYRWRLWDRLASGWFSAHLDAQLAAGRSPERGRLRAVRAAVLVDPSNRAQLAAYWEHLLERAHSAPAVVGGPIPLAREQILTARPEIVELSAALRARSPVPVRGVAQATMLLTDGTGPVYSRHSRRDLRAELRTAIARLDPASELTQARA